MDRGEMDSLVRQLRAAGLGDEQIMETFYETFQDGKMDRGDLEACAEFMGYELTDGFKADASADPIDSGAAGGITKEQAEEAKEIDPGESADEFRESAGIPDGPEAGDPGDAGSEADGAGADDDGADAEADEDEEWKEAQKRFKW